MSVINSLKVGSGQIAQLGEKNSNSPSVESVADDEQQPNFKVRDFPSFDQMEREINGKDEEVKNRPSNFIQEIVNERLVKQ